MNKITTCLLALSVGIGLASCNDDNKSSVPPTFKGFTYAPNPVHPGDTVKINAVYASKGEYVYSPRCTWTLSLDTLSATSGAYEHVSLRKQYKGTIQDDQLTVSFAIPKTARTGGTATCAFNVSFDNAVDTPPGLSLPNTTEAGYVGRFRNSLVKSVLYSECSGDLSFTIE